MHHTLPSLLRGLVWSAGAQLPLLTRQRRVNLRPSHLRLPRSVVPGLLGVFVVHNPVPLRKLLSDALTLHYFSFLIKTLVIFAMHGIITSALLQPLAGAEGSQDEHGRR